MATDTTQLPTEAQRTEFHWAMMEWGRDNVKPSLTPNPFNLGPSVADCYLPFTRHLATLGHTPQSYMATFPATFTD